MSDEEKPASMTVLQFREAMRRNPGPWYDDYGTWKLAMEAYPSGPMNESTTYSRSEPKSDSDSTA